MEALPVLAHPKVCNSYRKDRIVTEIKQLEEVDLEDWAKNHPDQKPPQCRRYRIRVDKQKFVVHKPKITGREILALVGYTPDKWNLAQKFCGGRREPIEPDEVVNLRRPGVERFETSPKQVQAGG